jgi:hypothetical protein
MDFAKLVAMLESRALYFARLDLLGDPFEGASGIEERRDLYDAHYLEFFRDAVRTAPRENAPVPPEDQIERDALRLLEEFHQGNASEPRQTYVSCWHANAGESEALWRLYCPPPTTGIAIRTELALLSQSWADDPRVEIGKVNYIDFRHQYAGTYDKIFSKRKSLSHEAEVRAAIRRHEASEVPGIQVKCDITQLVKEIVVSPFAPSWFVGVLEATLAAFDTKLPILTSELLAQPFF